MTDDEIKHLGKTDLLKIIRDQEAELEQDRAKIEELNKSLADKATHLEKCGSIADASLELNGVFQAAQAAANQYLAEIREKSDTASAEADKLLSQAREKADTQIRQAIESAGNIESQGKEKAEAYWQDLNTKLEAFYESHVGLKELLKTSDIEVNIPKLDFEKQKDE
jgi:cell division septum initiation protein DivIVA